MGHQPQLDCVGADLRMFLCFPQVQPSASTFTSFSSATLLNNKTELARHFGKECEKRSSLFFFPFSSPNHALRLDAPLASSVACSIRLLAQVKRDTGLLGICRNQHYLVRTKQPKLFCRLTFRARPGFLKESLFVSITLGFSPISCQYSLLPPLLHVIHTNCHVFIAFLFSTLPCVDAMCGPCGLPPTPLDPLTPPRWPKRHTNRCFFS